MKFCPISSVGVCYVKPQTLASQSARPLPHILPHSAADVARSSRAAQKGLLGTVTYSLGLRLGPKLIARTWAWEMWFKHTDLRIVSVSLYAKESFLRKNYLRSGPSGSLAWLLWTRPWNSPRDSCPLAPTWACTGNSEELLLAFFKPIPGSSQTS